MRQFSGSLFNPDLAPVPPERRTWSTYNYAALWVSMSVSILTYMLAAGYIQGGMSWRQGVATIFLGNSIVLVPMLLNSHPGDRYGIPFPVLARASFGVLGANIPALLRALVACGWFGIQTWIGGQAINTLLMTLWPSWKHVPHGAAICFAAFWLINLAVIVRGVESVRFLQGVSAPFLLGVGLLLLGWAYTTAGGLGPMLAAPSRFATFGEFVKFFVPALNGAVGFWAIMSLNIPDFTRFARSQSQQMLGQALALPATMTLYSFIGVAVTSATMAVFGQAIWDPVALLSRFESPVPVVLALLAVLLATLNVNLGVNVIAPANDFSNLWPRRISFKAGGVITCFVGVAMMPWKLLADYRSYIFGWLGGYAAVLGPVAAIMICDYFVLRRKVLLVEELYIRGGFYEFSRGFNGRAIAALVLGAATALLGLLAPPLRFLYDFSWFVSFAVAFALYYALMQQRRRQELAAHR